MGLSYDYPDDGSKPCSKEPLKVRLDGTPFGEIRKVKDGFEYFAKGEKKGRGAFGNVSEVQNSLLSMQSRRVKAKTPAEDSTDKIMKQAKEGLKKQEAELKQLRATQERSNVLLQASYDLFNKQGLDDDAGPVNLLEQTVNYDGTDCDGHTLVGDLAEFLEAL